MFESNLCGEDNMTLREEADKIIKEAITKVLPDEAVKQALKNRKPVKGKTLPCGGWKSSLADGKCSRKPPEWTD